MELLKLAAIFVLILIFLGLKKPLYLVMLGATVLVGIFFAMPPLEFLRSFGLSLINPETLEVILVIWFVMLLEGLLGRAGYLQRMLNAIDELFHSKRIDVVSMPMIIGFLPSAGGALFSAPMVDNATASLSLSAEQKSVINVYYRHIMEIFFPTYPSLLIIAGIAGVPVGGLSAILFPMAVLAFFSGFLLLRGFPRQPKQSEDKPHDLGKRIKNTLLALWPFLFLIVLIMLVDLPVSLSCLIALLAVFIAVKQPIRGLPQLIREQTKGRILLASAAVMVFKDLIQASGAVETLPELVSQLPIPPVLIFSLLCVFIGMLTGLAYSATGIVTPLLMTAIPDFTLGTIAFIHLSSYIGVQITPTHLCVSITSEYFGANLQKVLLQSLPIYFVLYLIAAVVYGFLLA